MELKKLNKRKTYHFIGIGGCGMSALAKTLIEKGISVSGSDIKETLTTIKLKDLGANIFIGHKKENLKNVHVIVKSTAIKDNNPEIIYANEEHLPILHRSDILQLFIQDAPKSISVTGTHGKTTTSAMLTQALQAATSQIPSFIIGSHVNHFSTNGSISNSDFMIIEADESDGSFVKYNPTYTIITNIETEHLEYYGNEQTLLNTFKKYIQKQLKNNKKIIYNQDCPQLKKIVSTIKSPLLIGFGIAHPTTIKTTRIKPCQTGIKATLTSSKNNLNETLHLPTFGRQNIENALAVLQLIDEENLPLLPSIKSLNTFLGTKRRSELIGHVNNIKIYDDYAHHPSEIHCTLKGMKESLNVPICCIFQPHRYSRTRDHLEGFSTSFEFADQVIVTQIFAANERPIPNISGQLLCERIKKKWPTKTVSFIKEKSLITSQLIPTIQKNHIIITMGAGNIHTIGKELINQLKKVPPIHEN